MYFGFNRKNKQKDISYVMITVTWSEVPDQSYCYNDKFIIYPSHVIENFEKDFLDQLFNIYLQKKKNSKEISLIFLCVL